MDWLYNFELSCIELEQITKLHHHFLHFDRFLMVLLFLLLAQTLLDLGFTLADCSPQNLI